MRIAGTLPCSVVNGTGVRFVVFVQGCAHHCPECHNPDTWDFDGGDYISPEALAEIIKSKPYIDGVTLSGGDPFYQQAACLELMEHLPADTDLWVYTGFEYDEIKDTALAKRADVLVTGPYIKELRCVGQMYGSSNQEIHRKGDTGCS
jgi:anaerobic ribonucleoside-triphosphate reductase activating protein